ncbi:MAG TPA: hypothetical protein VFB62_20440 [Polyangiaceae bacterium]|nr:hypothetical protein [Polyangiaceae bacterium]
MSRIPSNARASTQRYIDAVRTDGRFTVESRAALIERIQRGLRADSPAAVVAAIDAANDMLERADVPASNPSADPDKNYIDMLARRDRRSRSTRSVGVSLKTAAMRGDTLDPDQARADYIARRDARSRSTGARTDTRVHRPFDEAPPPPDDLGDLDEAEREEWAQHYLKALEEGAEDPNARATELFKAARQQPAEETTSP